MAKLSQDPAPTLLVTELWGLGDLALAVPFLRAACATHRVALLAKPHASPILARFAPGVELFPFVAPWTAFRGKYKLLSWPWREMGRTLRVLRSRHFETGVSARFDPRDPVLLRFAGARRTFGFPRLGCGLFLSNPVQRPVRHHRSDHWAALASALGIRIDEPAPERRSGKRILIHAGAGSRVRIWPRERFDRLSRDLEGQGWQPEIIDDSFSGIDRLIDKIDSADRFIGNDSGPGHIAALLGVPTFTIFGPQLPELFSPRHPAAQWIEGSPCPYKPCSDYCRFPEPYCLNSIEEGAVLRRVDSWLQS